MFWKPKKKVQTGGPETLLLLEAAVLFDCALRETKKYVFVRDVYVKPNSWIYYENLKYSLQLRAGAAAKQARKHAWKNPTQRVLLDTYENLLICAAKAQDLSNDGESGVWTKRREKLDKFWETRGKEFLNLANSLQKMAAKFRAAATDGWGDALKVALELDDL